MNWATEVRDRIAPVADGTELTTQGLGLALAVALALVLVGPLWHIARLAVTLVHELGHAVVGLAVGRRFVGFVIRGDMSGHAVTTGPARGLGRVATAWAGYPAPALVGAGVVWLAVRGWSAPVVTIVLGTLVIAVTRIRSPLTALVMLASVGGTAALWWWRDDAVQEQVLVCAGLVLIVGAWRHVATVMSHGTRADDPAVLAQLTHIPRLLWNISFLAVVIGASWLVAVQVLAAASGS